jgi:hypothetical protein
MGMDEGDKLHINGSCPSGEAGPMVVPQMENENTAGKQGCRVRRK